MSSLLVRKCTLQLISFLFCCFSFTSYAQQVSDDRISIEITNPTYTPGTGPTVGIDAAHNNFHTADGRFKPFYQLITADGFQARSITVPFDNTDEIGALKVLVIANALAEKNIKSWRLPTPSAFTESEIIAVKTWVEAGGSLLLIADHLPFPGAAAKLAEAFGILFSNGYAISLDVNNQNPYQFSVENKLLMNENVVIQGRGALEQIQHVSTFTGQAFRVINKHTPIMMFPGSVKLFFPQGATNNFNGTVPSISAENMLQGALLEVGKGRVAVFGEAAMFTAQLVGNNQRPIGFNHPAANDNAQFVLNVMHWLARLI